LIRADGISKALSKEPVCCIARPPRKGGSQCVGAVRVGL
jgi:hypothetical protein